MKAFIPLIICLLLFSQKLTAQDPHYKYIAINEIKMWISNTGNGSHDPNTDASGFFWPDGPQGTLSSIFADGLLYGGVINSEIRVNGDTYRFGLQPGVILPGGIPADPADTLYKVWRIRKDWELFPPGQERDELEFDYNNWPVSIGAPWEDLNLNGTYEPGIDKPKFVGDEVLFSAANDLDTSRTTYVYGSLPMGIEFLTTVWGFDSSNFLADVVFKKYLLINKGTNVINDMYLSYWSDPDLGQAVDDFEGSDRNLSLGYVYNADNDDEGKYGIAPPAVGHMFVQGPIIPATQNDSAFYKEKWITGFKNLPMNAFMYYHCGGDTIFQCPEPGVYESSLKFYNNMQGLSGGGYPIINPVTGEPTRYCVSGDPETGTGWYEGAGWPGGGFSAGDRVYLLSSGPFNFNPGDTQEVVIAIFMDKGSSNINSVTTLKNKAVLIHNLFGNSTVSDINNLNAATPSEFSLLQNYPNPFNPSTVIQYEIPERSFVELKVFDILGREIASLVNEEQSAGTYTKEFNIKSANLTLASGMYIYQLKTNTFSASRKMMLVK